MPCSPFFRITVSQKSKIKPLQGFAPLPVTARTGMYQLFPGRS